VLQVNDQTIGAGLKLVMHMCQQSDPGLLVEDAAAGEDADAEPFAELDVHRCLARMVDADGSCCGAS
jgi:hypothetical protein